METALLVAVVVVLVSLLYFLSKKGGRKYLPGPWGLPVVGYLPFITRKPYLKLQRLMKKYGPVYGVQLGSQYVVVLCDFQSIKQAFADDAFIGRPPESQFQISQVTKDSGILGMKWPEQRKFSMHMLRDLGLGKSKMDQMMREEVVDLLERLNKHGGRPVIMSELLTPSMSNNIASLIFGRRMEYGDPKRKRLDKILQDVGRLAGTVAWTIFFPWTRAVLRYFNIGNIRELSEAFRDTKQYVREEIKEHQETLDPDNIRDYIDGYLLEMKKRSNDSETSFKMEVLEDLVGGIFGAGSETVRIAVEWMLLVAAGYPKVQAQIQQEIDDVLGSDRLAEGQDVVKMPYTEAAIMEIMRWRTIIPLNIMRYTLQDTELNGYFIPKHSSVLAVLWAVHNDKSLWGEDTDIYRPERFLSEDGQKTVKPEYFIPFSVGKRSCPGVTLAEREAFLYVTAILQKFKLSFPPDAPEPDFEGTLGLGLMPKKQGICIEVRH